MRIGVVNWTARRVGGAERYLSTVLPALADRGNELAMLVEMDRPTEMEPIFDGAMEQWSIEKLGLDGGVRRMREWGPDVVFLHIILDPEIESAIQTLSPCALFTHAYYGTCISGTKTRSFPTPTPCDREFGPGCLVQYFPRRCGGLNPLTMLRDYGKQRTRNRNLAGYTLVITNSEHLAGEYRRNGVDRDRVVTLPMPVVEDSEISTPDPAPAPDGRVTLLFAGRMDRLKGGAVAIDAMPRVAELLQRPVRLVMVGDGPQRERWEKRAEEMLASRGGAKSGIDVAFPGWVQDDTLKSWFEAVDLLLVPSLWPEPFGLVGVEAAATGLPAVAFPVGGIPEWLKEGVNGHLTVGRHDAPSLAEAVARAVGDRRHTLALRLGATEVARRFAIDRHVERLEAQLARVARRPESGAH